MKIIDSDRSINSGTQQVHPFSPRQMPFEYCKLRLISSEHAIIIQEQISPLDTLSNDPVVCSSRSGFRVMLTIHFPIPHAMHYSQYIIILILGNLNKP